VSDDNGTDDSESEDEQGHTEDDETEGEDGGKSTHDLFDTSTTSQKQEKKGDKLEKERRKGRGIKRQLEIWDSLLEVRIQLQKVMCKVNQLPQLTNFEAVKNQAGDSEDRGAGVPIKQVVKTAQTSLTSALDEMLGVQSLLRQTTENPEDSDDNGSSPAPPAKKLKLKEYSTRLEKDFSGGLEWRDATIDKWNDKTQLASASSKSGSGGFAAFELSTLKQIAHILSDKSRLVKRTQLKRSQYQVIGKQHGSHSVISGTTQNDEEEGGCDEDDDHDEEIFDDDDFYHQLLRDLIEKKSSSAGEGDLGQKWLQIQKLRSKSKKKVDRRASKGRRIRYDIHAKLVNFMAPVAHQGGSSASGYQISEEAKNELFNSLFK